MEARREREGRKGVRRVRPLPAIAVVLTCGLMATIGGSLAVAGGPEGSVKLPPSMVKEIGPITCGKIGKNWFPGTYKRPYFLSFAAKSENLSDRAKRTASKKAKAKLFKKAKKLAKKARRLKPICNGPGPLRFDLEQARGLALLKGGPARDTGAGIGGASNLETVAGDGSTEEAASSGTAKIARFLIAPDDTVYLLFERPVNLQDTASFEDPLCLLARVDPESGTPSCVDGELTTVNWIEDWPLFTNDPIQFGPDGAIFYVGTTKAGRTVLRRVTAGGITDLITDYVFLEDFLVAPDGSVIVAGRTTTTGAMWTRRVTPAGGLQSIFAELAQFLDLYPDGRIYMGTWTSAPPAVHRYVPASNQLDPKPWIASAQGPPPEPYFDVDTYCAGELQVLRGGFCYAGGSSIGESVTTSDGQVFVIATTGWADTLVRYYPSLAFPDGAVRNPGTIAAAGTKVVVAGLNQTGQNIVTVYDPVQDEETTVVGPAAEIEVYHLSYAPRENEVLFDGLRFADNSYVLGRINMATNAVTVSPAGDQRWEDFEAFR